MKNIFILIFCMIFCVSCNKYGKCQINYSVIYPDTIITYDTIFHYKYYKEHQNIYTPYVSSNRGTNYIVLGVGSYNRTTCPIRINSYKKIND